MLTGDNYVGKLFKPFLHNTVRKPAFRIDDGSPRNPFNRIKSEVLIASKFRNCNFINKIINSYIFQVIFPFTSSFLGITIKIPNTNVDGISTI